MDKVNKKALTFTKDELWKLAKLALILFAITAVVGLMLSAVNEITKGKIAQQNEQKVKDAMQLVLPAEDYEQVQGLENMGVDSTVTEAYVAKSGSENIGYCIKVAPLGFGGAIEMVVGIDAQDKVTMVNIVGMEETPGLGTKAQDENFLKQYTGKSGTVNVTTGSDPKEDEIVALTGATVTSKAVTTGVQAAMNAVSVLKGGASNG